MVAAGASENAQLSEVIFVIECTATSGLYFSEIKNCYLVPTLEYFHGGVLEEGGIGSSIYAAVICHSSDVRPSSVVNTLGPYNCPQQFLDDINKLDFIGGHAEGNICLAEAMSTALTCFEDLASIRRSAEVPTKHVIIMCASPPYTAAAGGITGHGFINTVDEAATALGEKGVNVSIIAPRKLNSLVRIFERSGGEYAAASNRPYAKDARHMVMLRGVALEERVPSPVAPVQTNEPAPVTQQPPLATASGANAGVGGANVQPNVLQHDGYRSASPRGCGGFPGPVPYRPPTAAPVRWLPGPPQHQQRPNSTAPSALLSQLREPAYTPREQFNPRGVPPSSNPGGGGGPQMGPSPNSQVFMPQPGGIGGPSNAIGGNVPGVAGRGMGGPGGGQPATSCTGVGQQNPQQGPNPSQPGAPQRQYIWEGTLGWTEKGKGAGEQQKISRQVACTVSTTMKDSDADLKADLWPRLLMMQLIPKLLFGPIGGQFLKDSKSVIFHPQPCEALDALTKVLISGFAGCVHFHQPQCEIKVLILLYVPEKDMYHGFIPNNQTTFVDHLRRVIQQQKNYQQKVVGPGGPQGAQGVGPQGPIGPGGPQQQQQGQQQQPMQQQMGQEMGGMQPGGMQPGAGGPMGHLSQQQQQSGGMMNPMGRPIVDDLEVARQQNLEKIQKLQQTLVEAQQQENVYKSQLDIMSSHLHVAKQQEQQYKQLEQERQNQAQMAQLQQQAALQQALRGPHLRLRAPPPHMAQQQQPSNPGLRHLLQQQPQYRTSGPVRAQSQQQFDDVPNYDFM